MEIFLQPGKICVDFLGPNKIIVVSISQIGYFRSALLVIAVVEVECQFLSQTNLVSSKLPSFHLSREKELTQFEK